MDLRSYLDWLQRWWWLLLIGPLVAGFGGIITSGRITPTYQASASVLVNPVPPEDSTGAFSFERFANTYAGLITSPGLLQKVVADRPEFSLTVEGLEARVRATPIRETQLIEIHVRDEDSTRAARIANTIAEAVRDENPGQLIAPGTVSIVKTAGIPIHPVSPNRIENLMLAAAFGLIVAGLVCFALESLDDTVRTREASEAALGLPGIGEIVRVKPVLALWEGPTRLPAWKAIATFVARRDLALSALNDRESADFREGFRKLRASILFSNSGSKVKTIVVTSPCPREGKSTTAANLAIVLSEAGDSVILVDADLRRSSRDKSFDTCGSFGHRLGLTGLLANDIMDPLPALVASGRDNLRLLPSGPVPKNPAELLTSERMWRLISRLREEARFVIFDTPPVLTVADAVVFAAKTDATIIVAEARRTRSRDLRRAGRLLKMADAIILGFVLNKAKTVRHAPRRLDNSPKVLDFLHASAPERGAEPDAVSANGAKPRLDVRLAGTSFRFPGKSGAPTGQQDEGPRSNR